VFVAASLFALQGGTAHCPGSGQKRDPAIIRADVYGVAGINGIAGLASGWDRLGLAALDVPRGENQADGLL
jgi:hypothetical protein